MAGPSREWLEKMAAAEDKCGGHVGCGVRVDTETIDKLFLELSQFTNAKTAQEEALEQDVAFWKRMFERSRCGCFSLDCGKHGAYDGDDIKRVEAALGI